MSHSPIDRVSTISYAATPRTVNLRTAFSCRGLCRITAVWLVTGSVALAIMVAGVIVLLLLASEPFVSDTSTTIMIEGAPGRRQQIVTGRNMTIWILLSLIAMARGACQDYFSSFLEHHRGHSVATIGQRWSIVGLVGCFSCICGGHGRRSDRCADRPHTILRHPRLLYDDAATQIVVVDISTLDCNVARRKHRQLSGDIPLQIRTGGDKSQRRYASETNTCMKV